MEIRSPRSSVPPLAFSRFSKSLCALAVMGAMVGCAPPADEVESVQQPGLSFNGLSFNGLSFNGAGSQDFADWFNLADSSNIAQHDMTMKYVIRCAIAAGRTAS